jgi:Zn-dependent M28 family amino/carboxypeptidase
MFRWRRGADRAAAAALAVVVAFAAPCALGGRQPSPGSAGFDASKAYEHVRQMVALGPRPAGTPANQKTRAYIVSALAQAGLKAAEQPFDAETPVGRVRMANIIATIAGQRPERVALASHFDTKPIQEFRFVGANDGGSSTGALLELARALKARTTPLPFSIEFIFFDGEEAFGEWRDGNNTFGSRHYVQAAQKAGTLKSLRALVLLDMIGDRGLNLRRDPNSTRWLTDVFWSTARSLGHAQYFLEEDFLIEDDHIPFLKAGVPAVDLIDLDYADWHTAGDTLDKVAARSLQIVGDVVLAALPQIEARLLKQ